MVRRLFGKVTPVKKIYILLFVFLAYVMQECIADSFSRLDIVTKNLENFSDTHGTKFIASLKKTQPEPFKAYSESLDRAINLKHRFLLVEYLTDNLFSYGAILIVGDSTSDIESASRLLVEHVNDAYMDEFALLGEGMTRSPYLNAKKLLGKDAMSPALFIIVYYSDGKSIRSILIEHADLMFYEGLDCSNTILGKEYNIWFNFATMRKYINAIGLSEVFKKLVPFKQ